MFRRFGHIQTRLILEKQDKLRLFENKLDKLDTSLASINPNYLKKCNLKDIADESVVKERMDLMNELETTFLEYGTCSVMIKRRFEV
jgi:hypothetical protein